MHKISPERRSSTSKMSSRKEISEDMRRLVLKLSNESESMSKIGKTVNLSKATVQTIIKNFKTSGSFASKERCGRPTKLDERAQRIVIRKADANPKTSAVKMAVDLRKDLDVSVSAETVRRTLKKSGYSSHLARKKPFISDVNRAKRLEYGKKYEKIHQLNETFWERVIFTDECKFNVFGSDRRAKVWRKPGTALHAKNLQSTVKHGGGSVMVWGCMASSGVGELKFVEGIMDRHMYVDILKKNFLPSITKLKLDGNFIFMHDNDPKHSSHICKEWLLYNTPRRLEHPPQSPDLNVIEHLWDYLKRQVKNRRPTSVAQLKAILVEEWNNVPPDFTKKLANSMPNRLKAVVEAKGGNTDY